MFPNISAELARRGMTKAQLSEFIGVNRKTVYGWMHEKSEIPVSALIKMSKLFNCSTDYLLGLSEQKNA